MITYKNTIKTGLIYILLFSINISYTQKKSNEDVAKEIYELALTESNAYHWLEHLTKQIGARLSGSLNAELAVQYTKEQMDRLGFDKVWLQPVKVPKWVRGLPEYAYIQKNEFETTPVPICALGGSIATPSLGLRAKVIEVKSLKELETLGEEKIKGKIVFYNRPMNPKLVNTFQAYSEAVNQRVNGAKEASKYGAVGTVVRSMSLKIDDIPHTGSMYYGNLPESQRIPAVAISTKAANLLSTLLILNPNLEFNFKTNSRTYPDVMSNNVIGELKGSEYPEKIITIGGHLDSWDLGVGAHDDGAGCVQSMGVIEIFKKMNYKPKHTIRVVMFMNEENGLRGGNKYAQTAKENSETHVFALESDSGGFTPRGFSFECSKEDFKKIKQFESIFRPYNVHNFFLGFSGADIKPLENKNNILAGLKPDSQRYFDVHHSESDTFESINKRELDLGTAAMTLLTYLMDNTLK